MIKRYNQFLNENIEGEMPKSEFSDMSQMSGEYTQKINPEFEGEEEEEVEVNPYEKALEDLAIEAGVEYEPGSQKVIVGEREVTFPSEKYDVESRTGFYQIRGIKGDFKTPQDVISAIEMKSKTKTSSELMADMSKLESRSYKSTRIRK
jgi:hypothetical protein